MSELRPTARRLAWFALVTLLCVVAAAAYLVSRSSRGGADRQTRSTTVPVTMGPASPDWRRQLDEIRAHPHVYYRSLRSAEFGRVAVAALDAPDDTRVVSDLKCDRLDFGRERGICLVDNRGPLGPSALAQIVDRDFHVVGSVTLPGVPIRARLSPDERYAAATVFVTGEHYDADFTTRTTLIDTQSASATGDLEQFQAERDGRPFNRIDFNYWGVTFTSDRRQFYATLGFTGTRFLVSGDAERRQLRVLRDNVECPSLSPDEQHIAFKSRVPSSHEWRLHVIDAPNGAEWPITGETRNIDDQVEWLDTGHVLYQFVEERGLPEEAVNIWMSPAWQGAQGTPVRFIRGASSPAVVRP